MQTDQCTVLRFQESFIFHSKNVRLIYKDFYYVLFAKSDNYQKCTLTNPGTMQYLYIHTDEQTAVVVIADDKFQ